MIVLQYIVKISVRSLKKCLKLVKLEELSWTISNTKKIVLN